MSKIIISILLVTISLQSQTTKSLILKSKTQIQPTNSTHQPYTLQLSIAEANSWLISTNIIINSIKSVKDIFKYSHNTTLVDVIQQEGFKSIYMKSESQLRTGLKYQYYQPFVKWLLTTIDIPEEYRKQFFIILATPQAQSESMITKFSTVFNKNSTDASPGKMTYMQMKIKSYPDKQKYDIMWGKFDSDFTLAPNIKVIQETTSKFNGANVQTVQRLEEYSRGVNDADVQMVIQYFEAIAYCKFANEELGLDVNIPDTL